MLWFAAVKVLDWGEDGYATPAETTALRASFEQEVAVWQKLDHPNVTKVFFLHSPIKVEEERFDQRTYSFELSLSQSLSVAVHRSIHGNL